VNSSPRDRIEQWTDHAVAAPPNEQESSIVTSPSAAARTPASVAPLLRRVLLYNGVVALAIAVVGGAIGALQSGWRGVGAALLAAALTAVFLGLTSVSILVAHRLAGGDGTSPVFYAVILGTLLVKFVIFFIAMTALRYADVVDPLVFGLAVVAAVLGSLVGDAVAMMRTRVPYVSDVALPGDRADG